MRNLSSVMVLFGVGLACGHGWADEAAGSDAFPVGSVWIGKLQPVEKGLPRERTALRIVERTGDKFTGQLFLRAPRGQEMTVEVTGTATNTSTGGLRFVARKDGQTRFLFRGTLEKGEVKLACTDVDAFGDQPVGEIKLEKQPDLRTLLR